MYFIDEIKIIKIKIGWTWKTDDDEQDLKQDK